jgi:hypothetical protein
MARATAPAKVKAAAPKKAKAEASKKVAEAGGKKAAAGKMAPAPQTKAVAKGKALAAVAKKTAAAKKAAVVKKAGAPKKAAARVVAVKKAAPRRTATRVAVPTPAARPPAARRGRAPAVTRKLPARTLSKAGPQVYTVSHLNESDFKADGLRSYALYRDLGIAAATAGLCQAHVIRFVPPCTDEVRKRHLHASELQLVYVLKGWIKNEFEGVGEQMMSVGSCWIQPSGIEHTVLDYSPDCEVLEIIVPADFKTEAV